MMKRIYGISDLKILLVRKELNGEPPRRSTTKKKIQIPTQ
jgi:hypothetical protein